MALHAPIDEGCATRYNPGVMDEVVANRVLWRQLDLSLPHDGYIGLQLCEYVGTIVHLSLPDGRTTGPLLVADCGAEAHQNYLDSIDFAVDLSWELAVRYGVIDAPLYGVTVWLGNPTTVDLFRICLPRQKFTCLR